MVIFHSYVKLPQGYSTWFPWKCNNPTNINQAVEGCPWLRHCFWSCFHFPRDLKMWNFHMNFHPTWNLEIPWDTLRYLEFLGAGNNSLFVFLPLTFASPVSGMPGENPLLFFDWFPRVPPSRITGFFGEPWVSLKKKTTLPPRFFMVYHSFWMWKFHFLGVYNI